MKKIIFFGFLTLLSYTLHAQRFGYVDTDYILENLPSYTQAKSQVEQKAKQWQAEIENKQNLVEREITTLETEKILLTEKEVEEREATIKEKRKEVKELIAKRFGPEGDLISLRQRMVKPIQDQIFNAVNQVAKRRKYSFVFDKGADLTLIYSDPKYDISEEVIRMVNPKARKGKKTETSNVKKRKPKRKKRSLRKKRTPKKPTRQRRTSKSRKK